LRRALALAAATLAAASVAGCHGDGDALLLVVVTASGSPMGVVGLTVTLSGPAGPSSPRTYARDGQQPISFPTTLTAIIPARAAGDLTIDVRAVDAMGATLASGHGGPIAVPVGGHETAYVELDCGGAPCAVDGGAGGTPDGGGPGGPSCGNGRVDPGETCDTAIGRGDPGACPPPDCDDGVACTRDTHGGDTACTAYCTHDEITTVAVGDLCCPAGKTSDEDPDCPPRVTCGDGVVGPKETCDTGIPAGAPGACPTAADCATGDACSDDRLISASTCAALCVHYPITRSSLTSDGCCPPGATNALDSDCPVVCGNGVRDNGEACDVGIPLPLPGSCPVCNKYVPQNPCTPDCDDDDPETTDFLSGTGCQATCQHVKVTQPISGDGYCRMDASGNSDSHAIDTDCPSKCGNGVLEPGEACDKGITSGGPNACPTDITDCPVSPSACIQVSFVGAVADCSARCATTEITACSTQKDGCCPAGCTGATDPDCSLACGDGFREPTMGEVCDTAIPDGRPGACPKACTRPDACTEARLVSAGTCAAACVLLPITEPRSGDGCCPFGANASLDSDCLPMCGNGVVESPERCDRLVPGSCPMSLMDCPYLGTCTTVSLLSPGTCSATCVTSPITTCSAQTDSCCPAGCTVANDVDCAVVCGDGVVSPGESCDRKITPGMTDACPASCDDGDACTIDVASGSVEACTRTCAHFAITACLGGDGCCPAGCTAANDADCNPTCGDGKIGAGETCDPPFTCPTTCPDDGDPCTLEHLTGDAQHCNAACHHDPVTTCSGSTSDACCPTGCTAATDSDC
jgi:hypothetical protein